jgi:magnesium-protoporphyrin O-methyltransferase
LAESGAERITSVDASASYIGVAREEAERRGYVDRTRYHRGDFTELAAGIEPADVVTLDRVICCFDGVEALVRESAKRARRVYGLVYPRYEPWVRVGIRVLNLIQRLRRSDFKVFCHPSDLIERLVGEAGLQPVAVKTTLVWQVVSFERTSVGQA